MSRLANYLTFQSKKKMLKTNTKKVRLGQQRKTNVSLSHAPEEEARTFGHNQRHIWRKYSELKKHSR